MALNRSNSLSINTGQTNSLFAQQNSNTNNNQQQNTPQQSGGLFGASTNQTGGGLFGSSNTQNQNTAGGAGGLFGGGTTQNQSTNNAGGGLFGSTNAQNQNTANNTRGIFGNTNNNQQQQNTGTGGSIFGGSSVFGQPLTGQNTFAQPSNNQPTNAGGLFGSTLATSTAQPVRPSAPSLLGATQHAQMNNSAPFGRLSMGQGTGSAPATASAVKVDYDTLRPTTRFDDCTDIVKQELEAIDRLIQQQEEYARQIEAFLPRHEENVNSLAPDVALIKDKAEDVEQALAYDAQGVEAQRRNAEKDRKDRERCGRVVANLALPSSYQFQSLGSFGSLYGSQQRPQQPSTNASGENAQDYDVELIGNYFVPLAEELQQTMGNYARNLAEIESHMRVIESSAISQAHQLHSSSMGGNQASSDDTVRELAGTLRGFEESILGVAGMVGECREGVNQLVLGRLGGRL